VMLAGVNDSVAHARELGALLGPDDFKVNLIPYNPIGRAADARRESRPPLAAGGMYDGSSRAAIAAFRSALERIHVPVTVRLTRGRDIEAACGQLAAAPKARRGSDRIAQPLPVQPGVE